MTSSWREGCWQLGLVSALAIAELLAHSGNCAKAQITPDSTLGVESSVVTPLNPESLVDVIGGGAIRGVNLFHSFREFNVSEGRGAYFYSPNAAIQNILARVTGNNPSEILGTLGTFGESNPNLFLVNPNGIIFGPNASLNVGGSFVATTADAIQFGEQGFFSASVPDAPSPLLTINPSAFLFERVSNSSLKNNSVAPAGLNSLGRRIFGLRVPNQRSLLLVGNNVSLGGGGLNAFGGRVELAGVKGSGTVGLNVTNNDFSLNVPDNIARADVLLTNGARVDVAAGDGGSIVINAQNLDISQTFLLGGIFPDTGATGSQAGDIILNATGKIAITSSFITSAVNSGSIGNGGDIIIQAGALSMSDGAQLNTSTYGQGDAGGVSIDVSDAVTFYGVNSSFASTGIVSNVQAKAIGNGGNISIRSGSLSLNSAAIVTSTYGMGNAGDIGVDVHNAALIDGVILLNVNGASGIFSSGAFSTVEPGAMGNGGNITVKAGMLSITNGGQMQTLVRGSFNGYPPGRGNAGSVNIKVHDGITFAGINSGLISGIGSFVGEGTAGRGGDINIWARFFSVTDGAQLIASTVGQGNAGNVIIDISDTITLAGVNSGFSSGVFSTVEAGAIGNGGNINITTGSLLVKNGGGLNTSTRGVGNAGSVNVNASDAVEVRGTTPDGQLVSFLFAGAEGTGNAGNIKISTKRLLVRDGAGIFVNSQGTGRGGNIQLQADSLTLNNRAFLSAETASATGGNIELQLKDLLLLRNNSGISTNAIGTGGNINIDAKFLAALENSDITANSVNSQGGQVKITAQGIFGTQFRERPAPESDITASSDLGAEFSGTVELNTPEVDPSQGLVELPAQVVDPSGLIASGCAAEDGTTASQFVVTGRGGLPPKPDEPLSSDAVWEDTRPPATTARQQRSDTATAEPPAEETTAVEIVPATGWVFNDKGEVTLIASAPNATLHSFTSSPTNCRDR